MKVVFLSKTVPHVNHGGGGVTAFSVAASFVFSGHDSHLVLVDESIEKISINADVQEQNLNDLRSSGVFIHKICVPGIGFFGRNILVRMANLLFCERAFSTKRRRLIKSKIDLIKPDAIVAYHWEDLALLDGLDEYVRVGLVGDPLHLPVLFGARAMRVYDAKQSIIKNLSQEINPIFTKFRFAVRSAHLISKMRGLFGNCDLKGAFAAHHSEDLSLLLNINCRYYRTPVPDPIAHFDIRSQRDNTKFKILHIGHLKGTATQSGLSILVEEVIPTLDRRIGVDRYELHLVGGHFEEVPEPFRTKIKNHPSIRIKGQVSPPHKEFLTSHMIIVPIPIELGIRVRIISAFSYGIPVVTHIANTKGIPELEHGVNCLLGESGSALGDACVELALNSDMQERLSKMGRTTFENYFSYSTAGAKIVEDSIEAVLSHNRSKA